MGRTRTKASSKMRKALFDSGFAVHETEEEFEKTLDVVAFYYNRAFSQAKIAEMVKKERGISVSQPMISGYIKKLKKRWRTSDDERIDHVNAVVEQLKTIKQECWAAYELSKKGERTVTREFAIPPKLKTALDKVDASADGDAPSPAQKEMRLLRKQIKDMSRLPAVQYLDMILKCVALEVAIRGLEAPKEAKLTVGGDDGKKVLDWTVHSNALPPARNIEEELDAIREQLSIEDAEVLDSKPLPQEPKKGKKK